MNSQQRGSLCARIGPSAELLDVVVIPSAQQRRRGNPCQLLPTFSLQHRQFRTIARYTERRPKMRAPLAQTLCSAQAVLCGSLLTVCAMATAAAGTAQQQPMMIGESTMLPVISAPMPPQQTSAGQALPSIAASKQADRRSAIDSRKKAASRHKRSSDAQVSKRHAQRSQRAKKMRQGARQGRAGMKSANRAVDRYASDRKKTAATNTALAKRGQPTHSTQTAKSAGVAVSMGNTNKKRSGLVDAPPSPSEQAEAPIPAPALGQFPAPYRPAGP